ncbi:MAG: transcriptional regulator [Oligoflexia bacterium]|nr:MAG: transcriptional regulator [Oligoflexia bacterium]
MSMNHFDLSLISQNFVSTRLTLAREMRGMTKAELAEKIGKTPSSITQFEDKTIRPDAKTIAHMSLALGIKPAFFSKPLQTSVIRLEACHFRSLRSTSQRERRKILALGTIQCELINQIEEEFDLPAEQVSSIQPSTVRSDEDIERLAGRVRSSWNMGLGPIPNLMKVLESKGILVSFIPEDCKGVDAFSVWNGSRPLIFLVPKTSTSRIKFDASHELGHLFMHHDVTAGDFELERQANRFASAFLLPREAFLAECPRRFNMDAYIGLKRRWGVSLAALIRRAFDLNCMSEPTYRRANILLNAYRGNEPEEPSFDPPKIIENCLNELSGKECSENLGLNLQDFESLKDLLILSPDSNSPEQLSLM